jgi:hypothetical protein
VVFVYMERFGHSMDKIRKPRRKAVVKEVSEPEALLQG